MLAVTSCVSLGEWSYLCSVLRPLYAFNVHEKKVDVALPLGHTQLFNISRAMLKNWVWPGNKARVDVLWFTDKEKTLVKRRQPFLHVSSMILYVLCVCCIDACVPE